MSKRIDIWFGAKYTISKQYHGFFRDIFAEESAKYNDQFVQAGIHYRYLLIDNAVAQIIKSEDGML